MKAWRTLPLSIKFVPASRVTYCYFAIRTDFITLSKTANTHLPIRLPV